MCNWSDFGLNCSLLASGQTGANAQPDRSIEGILASSHPHFTYASTFGSLRSLEPGGITNGKSQGGLKFSQRRVRAKAD